MTADIKKIAGTVLCLVLIALFPAILQPYVLQGPHIIQLMTEKLGQAQSLSVSQRVIFYNVAPQPQAVSEKDRDGEPQTAANGPEHKQVTPIHDEAEVSQPNSPSKNHGPGEINDSANFTGDQPAASDQADSSPVSGSKILEETSKTRAVMSLTFSHDCRIRTPPAARAAGGA